MFTSVLILLSFASLLAATPGDQRIIGGENISIEKVPWQVSLQVNGQHFCGGAIYNESFIITAAHCVEKFVAENLKIRAGSSNSNSGGVLVQAAGLKFHEKYTKSRKENDVAVIRLKNPLSIGYNIQPIPLAEEDPAEGSPALSTGWGAVRWGLFGWHYPISLQGVNIQIENRRRCQRIFWNMLKDDICAGVVGRAHCFGDSGGPLVVGEKLVGISSRTGNSFCLSPGFYVSVAKFRSWILKAFNEV
ncbi:trypsin alpha-4 [Drosophila bipectinata]|uniref:trypsin alpha-4 n=1 Tax=Drosophila bipectinata TaxID=42026 RepID=UPI001C8955A2|nr:trypsin alpha-4-like [Drosophila bipectinata]